MKLKRRQRKEVGEESSRAKEEGSTWELQIEARGASRKPSTVRSATANNHQKDSPKKREETEQEERRRKEMKPEELQKPSPVRITAASNLMKDVQRSVRKRPRRQQTKGETAELQVVAGVPLPKADFA